MANILHSIEICSQSISCETSDEICERCSFECDTGEYSNHHMINPLSPHDALKHHFTSLKTDLIFLQLRSYRKKIHETILPIHGNFLQFFSLASSYLHLLRVENCDSNSRLVVEEDDNNKFRPERVKV